MIAPMRPDRYLKMAAAMRREGMGITVGFASAGGENVYPIEVEKTLAAHPEVAEAAVIGVDDEQYGQRLAAFVVLEPGATLKQHVRENLANYKVPREIAVLDELPRGSTGKIMRAELQSRVSG
jgi:acyl-coenzyme A synthetase/AMP-(fatty) acid ligase